MTPVMQTRFGRQGNCFEACIASLLDMSIERIPDLAAYDDDGEWMGRLNEWLSKMGLAYFEARIPRDEMKGFFSDKDFCHVMIGPTNRFTDLQHAVVGRKGQLVHDPHPDGVGVLSEPESLRIGVIVRQCV
jgi:hypothetical protein